MKSISLGLSLVLLGGCVTARQADVSAPKDQATAAYWYDQPAEARVESSGFDRLWDSCQRSARQRLFQIDRADYRNGILTTLPLVSQQIFEFWRSDTPLSEQGQSSLGTLRRTIRFEFTHDQGADGSDSYSVVPKVLVQRQSVQGQRITNSSQYRWAVAGATGQYDDAGQPLVQSYWYAIGRDKQLEQMLADDIRQNLKQMPISQ